MAVITGRIEVIVNGVTLLNKAGAVASGVGLSGEPNFELEAVMGDTGLHGHTEKPITAKCEITITDRSDILLDSLARIRGDSTVIYRSAGGNGKTYTMESATCLRNLSITGGEGEVPLVFEGAYWTETTTS